MTGATRFRIDERILLLDLGFLHVTQRTVSSSDGETFERIVIEHPGAVAVVPLVDDDVVLLRQYRVAADDFILEIPAGKLDRTGEERTIAARRELAEETGYIAGDLTHLTDLWTALGFCDERISIYVARDVLPGPRHPVGPEEVSAEVVRLPISKALDLVAAGEIADAKTVAGLLLATFDRAPT